MKYLKNRRLLKKGFIELTHETGWKKPIQARRYILIHGKIRIFHFFSEWETFDQAIRFLKPHHSQYPIIINNQTKIGI